MATSNDTTYELTRDQIISAAMRKCGRLAKGQSPDATDLANAQIALNSLIAELQTLGMPLWARKNLTITLVAGNRLYTIGEGQAIDTPFPLKIYGAWIETINGGAMRELEAIAYKDFRNLNTETTGTPLLYSYQPQINKGTISLWPIPTSTDVSTYSLQITYQSPFQGFTSASETPDFPQEWQNALIYNLAVLLAPEYGVPLDDRKELKQEAKMHLDAAIEGSGEDSSIYFQRDERGR